MIETFSKHWFPWLLNQSIALVASRISNGSHPMSFDIESYPHLSLEICLTLPIYTFRPVFTYGSIQKENLLIAELSAMILSEIRLTTSNLTTFHSNLCIMMAEVPSSFEMAHLVCCVKQLTFSLILIPQYHFSYSTYHHYWISSSRS